jgi:DNA polymerase-1
MPVVFVVVLPGSSGPRSARLVAADAAGAPTASPRDVADLPAAVAEVEAAQHPRWVWPDSADTYGALLRAGVRVQRVHDLARTAALLDARAGRRPAPERRPADERPGLFETAPAEPAPDPLAVLAAQLAEIGGDRRLRLLVAAESAGALAAAELGHDGLPFSARRHDDLLVGELGARPPEGALPPRLVELNAAIDDAFGKRVNAESAVEVLAAFAREGLDVPNTQARTLREVHHRAVPLLLRHKELGRLHGTNGWLWLDAWVHGDRFRPVYVPGGTPSGRWASRGGGALQIPKLLRRSVVAEPGRTFVIADAGQLEPRVLAAMSGDAGMVAAAGETDLYAPVAAAAFAGDRARAKVAVLGVLYGATAGESRALLARLRRQFPVAVGFVEAAARAGERGEVVHSLLGRASPPPPDHEWDPAARGRFTRNFVVQATAAEWALCLVAELRRRLADEPEAELVFFQHDEVVVHCADPDRVTAHVLAATEVARRLVFGDTAVRFPMDVAVRPGYAEPEDTEPEDTDPDGPEPDPDPTGQPVTAR